MSAQLWTVNADPRPPNSVARYRRLEARRITAALTVMVGAVAAGAVVPLVHALASAAVIVSAAVLVVGVSVRWVARWARWQLEDRVDARVAAAWRAEPAARQRADADQVAA